MAAVAKKKLRNPPDHLAEEATLAGTTLDARGQREAVLELRFSELLRIIRKKVDDATLRAATEAPSDFEALVLCLLHSPPEITTGDPLFAARLRGLQARQQLIEQSGGLLSTEQAAKLLGLTGQAIHKRANQKKLLDIAQERRGRYFPAFQFTQDGKVVPGLAEVLTELAKGGHTGWAAVTFFLSPNERLAGRAPLDMLKSGELEAVLSAAQWYGEHGSA